MTSPAMPVDAVNLPDGERWWADGEVALDARGDLWSRRWMAPGPWDEVRPSDDGFTAHGPRGHLAGTARGVRPVPPPDVHGRRFRGWDAPEAARRTPWLWARGGAVWWWDLGTLYGRADGRTWAVAACPLPPSVVVGPAGEALVDGTLLARAAGRAVRLATGVEPLRWVRFVGGGCFALAESGPVRIATDGSVSPAPGIPWGPDRTWLPSDDAPGPPTLAGPLLAGPGGALWDLARGERVASIPPGLIAAAEAGFAIVPRAGGRVTWIDLRGGVTAELDFSLGADVVTRVVTGPIAVTADGRAWRLDPGGATPVDRPKPARRALPAEPLWLESVAEVAGRRWGWRTDGLLVRLPDDPAATRA